MGGMTWHYFAPYQEDTAKALEDLREEVFRSGNYRKPFGHESSDFQPQSIDELWQTFAQVEDVGGTHSILDIFQVSETPEMASVSPLPPQDIIRIFGTATPDKAMLVKAVEADSFDHVPRWHCISLAAFDANGEPVELLFYGVSVD